MRQIELESQNAALRAAQLELEASHNRYVDLYDFAPLGYLALTSDGLIQEANLTAAQWLGVARGQLLNRYFVSCVAPRDQDRWTLFLRRMMPSGDKHAINLAMRRVDGTVFPAQLTAAPHEVGDGDTALRIALTDLSDCGCEHERQFLTLMENLDGMVYRCRNDVSWSMEFVSEGSLTLLGVSPQELTSGTCNYVDFMHPQDREPVWCEAQANLAARRGCRQEYRIITRDGREKWVLGQARGVHADDGTLEAIEGFVTDITARKQREHAQLAILQAIPDLLFEVDEDGYYHKIYTQQPELLAALEASAIGLTLGEVLPAAAAEEGMAALREAARDGYSYGRQMCLALPQGESWFELSVAAMPLVAGTPQHFIVLSRDITVRKQAVAALKASEAQLREAQALAQMGSWELDLASNHLSWSAEIFRIFEIDPTRFDANYEQFLAAVHPDDSAAVHAAYQASVTAKTPYEIEHRLLLPSGRVKWVAERGKTVYDASGKPQCSLGTVQDITGRRDLQNSLEHALTRTRLLTERLVAIQEEERSKIAHELHDEVGQNLTAAKIYLQVMERMVRDHAEFPHENLREALAAVARTLEQVRNLSLILRPPQLDDLGLVVSLGALLERDAAAAGWVVHFDQDVKLEPIEPDLALACYRVAQESLTNIMRHAAASVVHVRLIQDTEELELAIRDDGRGFDVSSVARIGGMTSLGLFGMEERLRSWGGTFEIRSAKGRGTEVVARFPL